jgi:hypothetical protein
MEPSFRVTVPRHPGIVSPGLDDVLTSGDAGFGDMVSLTAENIELLTETRSLGKGWMLQLQAGLVFIPLPEMFRSGKYDIVGLASDAHQLAMATALFNATLSSLRERIVCIPYVDIAATGNADHEGWFSTESYMFLGTEDPQGNQEIYALKHPGEWYSATTCLSYLEKRYLNEWEALIVQIVDEVLGGEAFWEAMKQKLRERRLPFAPPEVEVNASAIFNTPAWLPRVIDGPEETLDAVHEEIKGALERAGFSQADAIATTYWRRNGAFTLMGHEAYPQGRAIYETLKDQKLCTMLLQRWQPTYEKFKAAPAAVPENMLYLLDVTSIEDGAAGTTGT